jgi:hypothetical protein
MAAPGLTWESAGDEAPEPGMSGRLREVAGQETVVM